MKKKTISIENIIRILLKGELTQMKPKEVTSYFKQAFKWVDDNHKYTTGAKLKKAEEVWKTNLNNEKV